MATRATPAPEGKGEPARLIGVLWDPKSAFRDIAARPRPWVPLALIAAMSLVFLYSFTQRVGWERFLRQQFETNTWVQQRMQNVPPEQRELVLERQAKLAPIGAYAAAVIGTPLIAVIAAAVLLFVFKTFLSAELSFRQVFAIVSYAALPLVISSLMALAVLFLKAPEDFDLQHPTITNVGAFLDPLSSPKWLVSLGTSLDAFMIWVILLAATGLSVATRRISFVTSLIAVAGVWVAFVLIKMGWASMFG